MKLGSLDWRTKKRKKTGKPLPAHKGDLLALHVLALVTSFLAAKTHERIRCKAKKIHPCMADYWRCLCFRRPISQTTKKQKKEMRGIHFFSSPFPKKKTRFLLLNFPVIYFFQSSAKEEESTFWHLGLPQSHCCCCRLGRSVPNKEVHKLNGRSLLVSFVAKKRGFGKIINDVSVKPAEQDT